MKAILFALLMSTGLVHAEEKVCQVKGMHCEGCTEMVEAKVCAGGIYSTCKAKITNAKTEMGEVRVITKDAAGKVDEKALSAAVKDAGYSLKKCVAGGKS